MSTENIKNSEAISRIGNTDSEINVSCQLVKNIIIKIIIINVL